jgi:hypothetical protein
MMFVDVECYGIIAELLFLFFWIGAELLLFWFWKWCWIGAELIFYFISWMLVKMVWTMKMMKKSEEEDEEKEN